MVTNSKIAGSLLGGAIGDALGYQIEFKRNIKDKEVTRFENDFGIISDDTQMTLFTANALLWRDTKEMLGGMSISVSDAIYHSYLDWLDTQWGTNRHENKVSWLKEIKELNNQRAPGNTCIGSLTSGKKGTLEFPINNSKGCGGIMRIAPIGLYEKDSLQAGKVAAAATAITHGSPLGIIPAATCAMLINILANENITLENALYKAMKQCHDNFTIYSEEDHRYFQKLVTKAIKLSKSSIKDTEAIKKIGEGWVGDEAFAIAIYSCLKYPNSFEDAIVCAVNHDGDSDSTGAIVGNIMGAYLGIENIPTYYKENVELKDVILEIANDLSNTTPINEFNENNNPNWINKYVKCTRQVERGKTYQRKND